MVSKCVTVMVISTPVKQTHYPDHSGFPGVPYDPVVKG